MGLSMLARNNGTRSAGQLIGQGGADALNAYGTWKKIQEAKARQEMLDKERAALFASPTRSLFQLGSPR